MPGVICPVCGYPDLRKGPLDHGTSSYEICPSCGFEFGYDDGVLKETYQSYRVKWIADGCKWWATSSKAPAFWDATKQLENTESLGSDDV